MAEYEQTDVLVVGSGIAGLAAALGAAREGSDVVVATKAKRPEGASSWWAQGGIAVTRDNPEGFAEDIIDTSDGTADPDAVEVLVENANDAVRDVLVETLDVEFDSRKDDRGESSERASGVLASDPAQGSEGERSESSDRAASSGSDDKEFDFAREAAHSEERILHVDASTGKHVHVPFLNHLDAHESIEIRDDTAALELIRHEGRVHGALLQHDGDVEPVYAGATVLATGGVGDLFACSTNPANSTGDGIAMAALAGADVEDMEYVQFHPTVYPGREGDWRESSGPASGESEARSASIMSNHTANHEGSASGEDDPATGPFLVSEAVRGEGALLRNGAGERFMPGYHPDAELGPRDVVARAVVTEIEATEEVWLDVSTLDFTGEFPDLAAKCDARGVDGADGIPVAPAEHFLCGGVAVDDRGRASLDRLYAVGECARTGVHGANRLASTSLLEGLVWGLRAGEDAAGHTPLVIEAPELLDRDPDLPDAFVRDKFHRLRRVMDEYVGLERDPEDLNRAQAALRRLKGEVDAYVRTRTSRSLYELRHASVTALLVTRHALANDESLGTHHLVSENQGRAEEEPDPAVENR
ncbi:L-aspartate oxidase [Halegenticoccus tardaugens]|uniref:L-aspartate oxidase n=1 Tax=Halegenticoccus tardaugens TaxID=2071624 RepID=UPI00100C07BC|nr:FAD-dependent oxidoreductase [Halegenticoccus tardaugens]